MSRLRNTEHSLWLLLDTADMHVAPPSGLAIATAAHPHVTPNSQQVESPAQLPVGPPPLLDPLDDPLLDEELDPLLDPLDDPPPTHCVSQAVQLRAHCALQDVQDAIAEAHID